LSQGRSLMFGAKVIAKGEQIEVLMATDLPGILIVDDNEDNRYTLQLMLESDAHERITCAAGGNEAIALIEKEKFSLVLLDLMIGFERGRGSQSYQERSGPA